MKTTLNAMSLLMRIAVVLLVNIFAQMCLTLGSILTVEFNALGYFIEILLLIISIYIALVWFNQEGKHE
jgi:hypothetical protein